MILIFLIISTNIFVFNIYEFIGDKGISFAILRISLKTKVFLILNIVNTLIFVWFLHSYIYMFTKWNIYECWERLTGNLYIMKYRNCKCIVYKTNYMFLKTTDVQGWT